MRYPHSIFIQEIPPPTEEEQEQEQALKASFRRVAGDDMEIDAYELRDILNTVFTRGKENNVYLDYCKLQPNFNDKIPINSVCILKFT